MFSMQVNTGLRLELLEAAHAEGLFKLTDSNPQQLRRWLPWVDGVRAIEDTLVAVLARVLFGAM